MNTVLRALKRVVASNDVWYHGRTVKNQTFDISKAGAGHNQQGPGFYFSSDKDDAGTYAYPDGIVMEVEIDDSSLVPEEMSREDAEYLLEQAEEDDRERHLSDWGGDREALLDALINAEDPYQQAWAELYGDNHKGYLQAMVDLGYDGHKSKPNEHIDTVHFVVYNPAVIDIKNVEDYEKED